MAPQSRSADVLVVGAGISGIAAAWFLRQFGISTIVLEARSDRIGGRIWSSNRWSEATVDLGASWVTHMAINPLVGIARTHQIDLHESNPLNITLTHADGTRLSDKQTADTLLRYLALDAEVKLRASQREQRGKPDAPVGPEFERVLAAMKLNDADKLATRFFMNLAVTEPQAAAMSDLSLYEWDSDFSEVMARLAVVPRGYAQIAEVLARRVDIRLDHVVQSIDYGGDEVVVSVKDRGQFRAPYAVVTLPHGVLAKDSVKFAPRLPLWKRNAIQSIHTGLSDKFFFLFPKVFWKSNRDTLGRIDETGEGRWSTWINFHRYTGQPVLLGFNHGKHAQQLESMTDDAVMAEAMGVLRRMYGPRTPDALRMQRSKWLADPFAAGTIPHVPPKASAQDYRTLARPVGRLRFAGDATNADFPGEVFGAFLSGIREAEKLIGLTYGISVGKT